MSTILIPTPCLFYVKWSCRRCGHTGGVAKTTVPFPQSALTDDIVRNLFDALRIKLVKVHARQGCIATVEDFKIEKSNPEEAKNRGL